MPDGEWLIFVLYSCQANPFNSQTLAENNDPLNHTRTTRTRCSLCFVLCACDLVDCSIAHLERPYLETVDELNLIHTAPCSMDKSASTCVLFLVAKKNP